MEVLFAGGKNLHASPLKLIYLVTETELPRQAQVMFVVPKRLFKKAHDRNKLKRRMKEAYRLNKLSFYASLVENNKKVVLAFLYTGKTSEKYTCIENSVKKLLEMFLKK